MKKRNQPEPSRRTFLKKSTLAGIGFSSSFLSWKSATSSNAEQNHHGELNEGCRKLMAKFNLQYPIFQAAPGGEDLAVAIANAGGMGAVSLGWYNPDDAYRTVVKMNRLTKGNYYANYVLHFKPASLENALEAGCPTVQFSWGIPDKSIVKKIRMAGANLGIQVSSKINAQKALEHQPEFLICQGLEAGGHVQATSFLDEVLPEILEEAGKIPVLVAGGISTGHDIRKVLNKGTSGVVLGSRLIATKESEVHQLYKQRLIEAGVNSTVYTNCFNQNWNAMHRVLRNKTFLDWEAEGCPVKGNKPGETDIVANHPEMGSTVRYNTRPPLKGHTGDIDDMAMYAGMGVSQINDIPGAAELIKRLWAEFENK